MTAPQHRCERCGRVFRRKKPGELCPDCLSVESCRPVSDERHERNLALMREPEKVST